MADLLDIAPRTSKLDVGGVSLSISPIQLRQISATLLRFPALIPMIGGSMIEGDEPDIGRAILVAPDGIAALVAAACGKFEDGAYEEKAASLLPEDQIAIIEAGLKLSFPNGIGAIRDRLDRMVREIGGEASSKNAPGSSKS